jgi:serine/threonine-protein kinase
MKKYLYFIILVLSLNSFGQIKETNWKTISEITYSIQYPDNWELNIEKSMGTSFILFSEQSSSEDKFRENINLIIQNLEGYNLNLDDYVAISEEQISKMVTNGKIIDSKRSNKNNTEFQKVIFTGKQGLFQLKFVQYYFIKDEKAYVLTFTCEEIQYEKYIFISDQILDSFLLNK